MAATRTGSSLDFMDYTGGEVNAGRVQVEQFEVFDEDANLFNLRAAINGRRSYIRPGVYHKLLVDGVLWMSDTPDEKRDHLTPVLEARQVVQRHGGGTALVNGLGLGMVTAALLRIGLDVDVVEIDPDIAEAMAPWVQQVADDHGRTLTVHVTDAFTIRWPTGTRWDVVWHDIWPTISIDNLETMGTLHRRYGQRCGWQSSWKRDHLRSVRDRNRRAGGWRWM